jgi:chromosome segregation ATPase
MSQIDELQTRITAALERIERGVTARADARAEAEAARAEAEAARTEAETSGGAALDSLRQELEDERLVTAQMEERIKVLHARLEEKEAALAALHEGQGAQDAPDGEDGRDAALARLDADLQALRAANEQLRQSNAALREAHAAGVTDEGAINAAMQAELDALRAARAADRDEVAAVLAEIDSAVAGATDQTEDA